MRWSSIGGFVVGSLCLGVSTGYGVPFMGFEHTALGNAQINVAPDGLTINNLGSSGQDGVSVDLGQSSSFQSQWEPIDIGPLPIGANFAFEFYGERNGVADQLLWRVDMIKSAPGEVSMIPDASPIGASSSLIYIYLDGQLQGTFPGVSGPITTTEMPQAHKDKKYFTGHVTLLKKGDPGGSDRVDYASMPVGIAEWPNPVQLDLPGIGPVQGNQLVMIAEQVNVHLGAMTRCDMLVNDIPSLTLVYEHAEAEETVPAPNGAMLVFLVALLVGVTAMAVRQRARTH